MAPLARYLTFSSGFLLLSGIGASAPRASTIDRVTPVIFELEPGARYAGTDIRHWQVFTRAGVTLSPDLRIEFVGVDRRMRLEGMLPVESELAVYHGNDPAAWIRHARGFQGVAYRDLY